MCRPCSFPRPSAAGFHFCWLAALGSSNNSCFQVFRHNSSEGNWAIGRSLPHAVGLFQSEGRVKSKGPEHIIPVLGSPLSFRGEPAMLMAEMQKRGRQAFWAHRGILLADAPLKKRLQNHVILVRQAALWGCQTWPCAEYVLRCANTLQAMQVRGMLQQRRGKTGPWLDWRKRSLRMARLQIRRCKIDRWSSFILDQIWSLYGHVARGDPVTAAMLSWRGMRWWRTQQSTPVSWAASVMPNGSTPRWTRSGTLATLLVSTGNPKQETELPGQ